MAGIGGLNNGAKRNVKADQLRPVPRHNVNKKNESYEDTEPRHCINFLLAVEGPSLHLIRSLVFCPPSIDINLFSTVVRWAFIIYFVVGLATKLVHLFCAGHVKQRHCVKQNPFCKKTTNY